VSTAPLVLIHHRGYLPSCLIMTRSHDSGNIPGRRASLNVKPVGQLPKLSALLCALSQPDHIPSNPLSGRERKPRCSQRNFKPASHAMPSKTPSADAPSDSPPQQAAPPGGGSAAGQSGGGGQAAGKNAGGGQSSPTGSGHSLGDEFVVEEEEESEDEPMEMAESDEDPPVQTSPPSVVPPPAATQTPRVSTAAAGLLSLEEAVEQVKSGVLPAEHTGPDGVQNVVPTRDISPPKLASSAHCFIVGVPADTRAYRTGKYVQDGYSGVESLLLLEGLNDYDLQDLTTLFAQDSHEDRSIHEMVLLPHSGPPPDLNLLEAELDSLLVRREVAPLQRQFPPKRLAERVFYTVVCLRRLLVRYQEVHALVRGTGDSAVDRAVHLSDLNTQLQHDVQFLNDHCEKEVNAVGFAAAKERDVLKASFRRLTADHLEEVQPLHKHIEGLVVELAEARGKVEDLETHAQKTTFKADELMGFLNDGSTELRGNWPRLRQLFKHFEKGTKPPAS
jgi:hypothetical protein